MSPPSDDNPGGGDWQDEADFSGRMTYVNKLYVNLALLLALVRLDAWFQLRLIAKIAETFLVHQR